MTGGTDAGFTLSRPWLTQLVQQGSRLLEPNFDAQRASLPFMQTLHGRSPCVLPWPACPALTRTSAVVLTWPEQMAALVPRPRLHLIRLVSE